MYSMLSFNGFKGKGKTAKHMVNPKTKITNFSNIVLQIASKRESIIKKSI